MVHPDEEPDLREADSGTEDEPEDCESGSSQGSGTEEEEAESGEEEGSSDATGDSSSKGGAAAPRRSRHRLRVDLLPPKELPQRATRANRYAAGEVAASDSEGDEDFWNQEFFQEEEQDEAYETESEPEDVPDRDFDESEEEPGSGEDSDAAEAAVREKKRKILRPPGAIAGAPRPRQRPTAARAEALAPPEAPGRRDVRSSTKSKLEEAEAVRLRLSQEQERARQRQRPRAAGPRPLTQAELLAEAARTELENTRSLALLQALEEASKSATGPTRARYSGPLIRWVSRGVADGPDGALRERSSLEVRNMALPESLMARVAPPPPRSAHLAPLPRGSPAVDLP